MIPLELFRLALALVFYYQLYFSYCLKTPYVVMSEQEHGYVQVSGLENPVSFTDNQLVPS